MKAWSGDLLISVSDGSEAVVTSTNPIERGKVTHSSDWTSRANLTLTLESNLRIAVENCYGSVALRTVFVSRQMLPASRKDVLPAI